MSGYTPVFNSVLDGTLYGRWPHTGVWLCLLSQCDQRGHIDAVPALLAAKIGVPEETLKACIADFMSPDPGSRTGDLEGRRLELIDPSRDWGWRVINHSLYRERARKQAYDKSRTASGADADRKREKRVSREVPTSPAKSRSQTQTQTHTQTQTKDTPLPPEGLDRQAFEKWEKYRADRKPAIKAFSRHAAMCEMAKLGGGQMAAVNYSIANGYQGLMEPKINGPPQGSARVKAKSIAELEAEELARVQH